MLSTSYCVEVKGEANSAEEEGARVEEIVEYAGKLREYVQLEKGMR